MRPVPAVLAALALGGCATTYEMTLMPRDSGKLYAGTIVDAGMGDGRITVDIDAKHYTGTWVNLTPERTTGWSFGAGFGRGRWGWGLGLGNAIVMDNPHGAASKALLNAQDGSGLRCDIHRGERGGGGTCRDDAGKTYDVQLKPAPRG